MTIHACTSPTQGRTKQGIAYSRLGTGRPVVLIHGWCLNASMWTYAQDALRAKVQVIAIDLPGFGRAADVAGPYRIGRFAACVNALLEELDLQGAVLVGFAFGAAIALQAATTANERIAGVVSIGVPTAQSAPYTKMPRAMCRDWPDFARRSAHALFKTPPSKATIAWLERMFSGTALHVALDTVDELAVFDPLAIVGQIAAPVLYLHADGDTVAPLWLGQACAEQTSAGRLTVIAECGHLMVIDQKAAVHGHLTGFIDELATGTSTPTNKDNTQ